MGSPIGRSASETDGSSCNRGPDSGVVELTTRERSAPPAGTVSAAHPGAPALLEVEGLEIGFAGDAGFAEAVSGIDLDLPQGRTLCLVGESGCGKSVTALALLGLLPVPPARVAAKTLRFEGRDLRHLPPAELRRLRGNRIAMIFQEPMTSLNPALTVGEQIGEVLREHRGLSRAAATAEAIALLERVRIAEPQRRVDDYPHRLSGGMRQRVMIAMALACKPALLVADEPTTALDVTVQAEILELLGELRRDTGMALLLITHDLGVVAEIGDEAAVMYAGRIVERCAVGRLFERPEHPYTLGLLGSLPTGEPSQRRLTAIGGTVPLGHAMPAGCRFHPRCPFAVDACRAEVPPLRELEPGHAVACWRAPLA